jgi:hypothetical protein
MKPIFYFLALAILVLAGCAPTPVLLTPFPTSTEIISPPTETTVPSPTVTPLPTLTPEPSVTATEAPAQVETVVEKIQHDTFEHLNSTEFAQWVLDTEAKGGFPRNPNAVPLTSINVLPAENKQLFDKYGFQSIFNMSYEDAQVLQDISKRPWSLAAIREFEMQGQKFYYMLVRWENKDGSAGFTSTSWLK